MFLYFPGREINSIKFRIIPEPHFQSWMKKKTLLKSEKISYKIQSNFQTRSFTEFARRSPLQIKMASFSHAYLDWTGASNLGKVLK